MLRTRPRHAMNLLFLCTGKGGVGKTSIACPAEVCLAVTERRVLLVSTDPASNVSQVFNMATGNRITPIPAVPGLDAFEIDPQAAAQAYRDRLLGPVRWLATHHAVCHAVVPLLEAEPVGVGRLLELAGEVPLKTTTGV